MWLRLWQRQRHHKHQTSKQQPWQSLIRALLWILFSCYYFNKAKQKLLYSDRMQIGFKSRFTIARLYEQKKSWRIGTVQSLKPGETNWLIECDSFLYTTIKCIFVAVYMCPCVRARVCMYVWMCRNIIK